MIRPPRTKFLSSPHASNWKKFVKEHPDAIEEAMSCALLELTDNLPLETAMPQQACDAYQQMVGARKLLAILSTIHEPQTTTKIVQPKGLDYNAGV